MSDCILSAARDFVENLSLPAIARTGFESTEDVAVQFDTVKN